MKKFKTLFYTAFAGATLIFVGCSSGTQSKQETSSQETKPNIVIIYLDDLGYGDVGAYGATEIKTPNMDRLANEGVLFTDGHASSSTCTPSRYALLTGVYPWRNKDAKILPGTAPLIIDTAQITIPKMLKAQGYRTGVVGKWHLGLGSGHVDWNQAIAPGPNEVGFDYSYIMAATQDRVPTVYIENGLVDGLDPDDPIQVDQYKNFEGEPTGIDNPELLTMRWHFGHNHSIVNGIPRIGYMKGGEKAKWSDVDMADHFLGKAQDFVLKHKDEPFFLYYALQQPHVPRTPNPRFVGSTDLGPRGDVIVEADWCIGEFLKTLEEEGLLENTLIIFSSDNGPVLDDGYYDDAVERLGDHNPKGGLRGGKYSLFEAGTRVPFVTYWKGKIAPKKSDALISQIDILASLAQLTGAVEKATDSQEMLDVLLGKSEKGRDDLVLEATSRTAYRKGQWLMIPPYNEPRVAVRENIELGNDPGYQLYDLGADIGQQKNVAESNPEKLKEMVSDYEGIVGGRNLGAEEVNP
ncbi:sulfatase family protein [Maribellus sediminis]|uniref:sulfatase family protein n=1 Tax=Maribellus sediminis TaxID=2696285 RepID=UPI00143052C8|nr:arylsulfatase [Maribellus sediminis]